MMKMKRRDYLMKLKYYCEFCKKNCKDESEYKSHCMSEFHQRQIQIMSEHREEFAEAYSRELEDGFLEHLRRCHGFRRVSAAVAHKGFVREREFHMEWDNRVSSVNRTKWFDWREFMTHLGRTNKCLVEEIDGELFVAYNVRESEADFLLEGSQKMVKRVKLSEVFDKIANSTQHGAGNDVFGCGGDDKDENALGLSSTIGAGAEH